MLCLLNEEFLMRKNNLQREKLKLEVEKLFFLLQIHFPPLEYAKFTARKTRHEVDKSHFEKSGIMSLLPSATFACTHMGAKDQSVEERGSNLTSY